MTTIQKIQEWYLSYCDGEWEHSDGITIETLDNPGWSVEINLLRTNNENIAFDRIEIERTENNWIHCWVENNTFNAACGPLNLEETLELFLKWAQKKD